MSFDATAFVGSWPFYRLGKPRLSDLLEAHGKNGITGGVVSSLEAVFCNDPMQPDAQTAKELPTGYLFAMTHNPKLPYASAAVARNPLGAAAVRLFPGCHGYGPSDPSVKELCVAAAEAGLVVYVVAKLQDVRLDHLFHQQVPALEAVIALADSVPQTKIVASGYTASELLDGADDIAHCTNLYVDTAYSGNVIFPYERLAAALPVERLLFGSHYPLLCMESHTYAAERARWGAGARSAVMGGNARRLFRI